MELQDSGFQWQLVQILALHVFLREFFSLQPIPCRPSSWPSEKLQAELVLMWHELS